MTAQTAADPVPRWRQQPYRLLFPLGVALSWAGVVPWLLYGLGVGEYRSLYHPLAQIQGFLACFALGFLFTMIPRRTQTAAPTVTEMVLAILLPVGCVAGAWARSWGLSQLCWLALLATLVVFLVRRVRSSQSSRHPPPSFVWLPVAIFMGFTGSVLLAIQGAMDLSPALYRLARLLLLQGVFVGLVVGIGGMLLPLITCGDSAPDADPSDNRRRAMHLLAAAALISTFVIESHSSLRLGLTLRAALVSIVLIPSGRIYRLPRRAGWNRWLVWLAAWMIPIGYACAALWPLRVQLGLHVVFIGGFAMMALSVGTHVALAHGDRQDLASGRPWQVPVMGTLLAAAIVLRGLVEVSPLQMMLWLALSATAFLLATLFWASLVAPCLGCGSGSARDR